MEKNSGENNIFGYTRPAACTEPLKRLAQTTDHVGPSNALRFGSDQRGIGSYKRSVDAAMEEVFSMEENVFGNVRLAACTRPPKRSAQIAGRAGLSFVQHFGYDQQGIGSCRRSV